MRETITRTGPEGSGRVRLSCLPVQATPIDRTVSGDALPDAPGVEPSFLGALAPFIPLAASVVSKFL